MGYSYEVAETSKKILMVRDLAQEMQQAAGATAANSRATRETPASTKRRVVSLAKAVEAISGGIAQGGRQQQQLLEERAIAPAPPSPPCGPPPDVRMGDAPPVSTQAAPPPSAASPPAAAVPAAGIQAQTGASSCALSSNPPAPHPAHERAQAD